MIAAIDLKRECAAAIQECGISKNLALGKSLHAQIAASSAHSRDRFLQNLLVQMYGRCGDLERATAVFHSIAAKNRFSWSFLITASASNASYAQALRLFRSMCLEGEHPDDFTLSAVFAAAAGAGDLCSGASLHRSLESNAADLSRVVGNSLLSMYSKCGILRSAEEVFDHIADKDLISWNAILAANAQAGDRARALFLFRSMQLQGFHPDVYSFASVLGCCSLREGQEIHAKIVASGLQDAVPFVGNALIHMYGMSSRLDLARAVFFAMERRDPITWNTLITSHAENGEIDRALEIYCRMELEGFRDAVTIASVISNVLLHVDPIERGEEFCQRFLYSGNLVFEEDEELGILIALMNLYGKHGRCREARSIFERIRHKSREVLCWNTLISAYAREGFPLECLQIYREMLHEGVKPNEITLASVLDSCASDDLLLRQGETIHEHSSCRGFDRASVLVLNTLIHMYGSHKKLDAARNIFDSSTVRDLITWSAMISAYSQQGNSIESIKMLRLMDLEGVEPNLATFVSLLDAIESREHGSAIETRMRRCGFGSGSLIAENALLKMHIRLGSLQQARSIFESMRRRDLVSWTSMIAASAGVDGGAIEALNLHRRMDQEGIKMNHYTAAAVVAAASYGCGYSLQLQQRFQECGFDTDSVVGTAFMFSHIRAGNLARAHGIFARITDRDVITWTMMISAYAQRGHLDRASQTYREMSLEGIEPNTVSFLVILFACSHSGTFPNDSLLSIAADHALEVSEEHYGSIVDLLGRSGRLDDAEDVARHIPSASVWGIFLASCKMHGDSRRALGNDIDPANAAHYVLLWHMFAGQKSQLKSAVNN